MPLVFTVDLMSVQSGKTSTDLSNQTSSKPSDNVDDDDDDDDDEPAEDMDAFVESGRLEAEDNVIFSRSLKIKGLL